VSGFLRRTFGPGPVGTVVRLRGVDPLAALDRADRVLVASDPVFEPHASRPANEVLVGPVLQERPRRGEPAERPTVLVSLSSTYFPGQQAALQRILDGLAALPVDVVVTAGRAVDPTRLRPGRNTVVHGFVDHAALLPSASLVVGHGGHATTVRALAHGLPVLVVPMHPMMDQPVIGRAVAAAGLGLTLPKHASPGAVRAAASHILSNERMAAAAPAFGERLAAHDGAAAAPPPPGRSSASTAAERATWPDWTKASWFASIASGS
jgi:UDP:flavonoid glycosyltransferase YjiC (YdhE family)